MELPWLLCWIVGAIFIVYCNAQREDDPLGIKSKWLNHFIYNCYGHI